MNNKAFTLIELLAVVILLSIIVFLVLPNVVGLLKDKETEIDELTFTIIKDATKLYMEDNNELYDKKTGNQYCISLSELVENEYLKDNIKYDGKDITNLMSIQVNYNGGYNYELVKNNDCVDNSKICKLISGEANKVGSKYECEVKPGTSYNFYVLTTPEEGAETINLIMDRNICEDGTLATTENTCLVAWQTSGANEDGPITAMDYLYNATKDWTNIPNIEMNYTDEGNTGYYGYGTVVTTDNITKITKKDGTSVTVLIEQEGYSNLKARLPYYSEVSSFNNINGYLYENLDGSLWDYDGSTQPSNNIGGIYGYWTLSSVVDDSNYAWIVIFIGRVSIINVDKDSAHGIRPVITVNL